MVSNARNSASRRHRGSSSNTARGHASLVAWWLFAVGFLLLAPGLALAGEVASERQEEIVAARIMRVLPGVVGIITEVSAEVTVRCGPKDTYVVTPDADKENGTGASGQQQKRDMYLIKI